jgi:hypothetical protein
VTVRIETAVQARKLMRRRTLFFPALAPGTATIVISDLAIVDPAGAPVPYAATSLTAQAEVLSGPL